MYMGMRKYQSVEKTEVVSPEGHKDIAEKLSKVGKTNAAALTEKERTQTQLLDK